MVESCGRGRGSRLWPSCGPSRSPSGSRGSGHAMSTRTRLRPAALARTRSVSAGARRPRVRPGPRTCRTPPSRTSSSPASTCSTSTASSSPTPGSTTRSAARPTSWRTEAFESARPRPPAHAARRGRGGGGDPRARATAGSTSRPDVKPRDRGAFRLVGADVAFKVGEVECPPQAPAAADRHALVREDHRALARVRARGAGLSARIPRS